MFLTAALLLCLTEPTKFDFTPSVTEISLPERYRLAARTLEYQLVLKHSLRASGVEVYSLTFPTARTSPHEANNTVHAEYYRPKGPGPFPGVVILDITGGDQSVSRAFAMFYAQNGIAGLFVQMAYYGPRRPPGPRIRMMSTNIPQTIEAVTQTVGDCRYAGAWLRSRREIDSTRVGIMGTSLGSMVATVTAEMEPRFSRLAILLGGGGLVDAFYDHPQAAPYRKPYELLGGTKDGIKFVLAPVDPLTCAANLKGRHIMMVNASRDEIIPPSASKRLWEALDRPKIIWYDTGHYGAALCIVDALPHLLKHFTSP